MIWALCLVANRLTKQILLVVSPSIISCRILDLQMLSDLFCTQAPEAEGLSFFSPQKDLQVVNIGLKDVIFFRCFGITTRRLLSRSLCLFAGEFQPSTHWLRLRFQQFWRPISCGLGKINCPRPFMQFKECPQLLFWLLEFRNQPSFGFRDFGTR